VPYFLVKIPGAMPGHVLDAAGLAEVITICATARAGHPMTVHEIDRDTAVGAGACDACPERCRSCTGERSSCECYEHGTPEPEEADEPITLTVQQLVAEDILTERGGVTAMINEMTRTWQARAEEVGCRLHGTLNIDIVLRVGNGDMGMVTIQGRVEPA
jgi:hypothetical protein